MTHPFLAQFKPIQMPDLGLVRFPKVDISAEDRSALGLRANMTNRAILGHLAWARYKELAAKGFFGLATEDEVKTQFRTEFATFDKTGVHDYLLLVWDYNRWADQQGIVRGWGRGSAASSLTLACLGITRVDPLRHKLNFPRFISEARMKPVTKNGILYVDGKAAPDVDCDYQYGRRAEVIRYIETKYAGRTCKISTRLELTGKTALKTALKVYGCYGDEAAQRVSDFIEAKFGKVQSLHEARESNEPLKKWLEETQANRDVYDVAMALEGAPVARGVHPSGVVVSYYPLDGYIPTELAKEKVGEEPSIVSTFDMETMALLAIKVDILGVRSLDLVANTAKVANVDLDTISVDDPAIYEYLNREEANYVGLFQIEDGTTKDAVIKVGPKDIDALSACLAISRPGALKYLDQYAQYYRTGELKSIYPAIDEVLKGTGNVLVYQEQITRVCTEVFGMSPIDADSVRYAVGKKKKEEMAKWEEVLRAQGKQRGVPDNVVQYFWDVCNASADYLFVLSHSCSYAYLTAVSTYVKTKYPQAYYLTMLRLAKEEPNPTEYMNTIIGEMRKVGIALLPPDITRSEEDFSLDEGSIRFGLASIKGISELTFAKLGSLRGQTFATKWDMFDAAKAASIQINMLCGLIYCGCLSWPGTSRIRLALEAQTYNLLGDNQKAKVKGFAESKKVDDIIEILKALPTALNEKGKPLISTREIDRVRRDYADYYAAYQSNARNPQLTHYLLERHYLGFSYSGNLSAIYGERVPDMISLDQLKQKGADLLASGALAETNKRDRPAPFKVVGFVEEAKSAISKAKGTPYLKLSISDDTASFMVMLFGEDRLEYCKVTNDGKLPEEGDIVIIVGSLSKDARLLFADSATVQTNPSVISRKQAKEVAAKAA